MTIQQVVKSWPVKEGCVKLSDSDAFDYIRDCVQYAYDYGSLETEIYEALMSWLKGD